MELEKVGDVATYIAVVFLASVVALVVIEYLSPGTGFEFLCDVINGIMHL